MKLHAFRAVAVALFAVALIRGVALGGEGKEAAPKEWSVLPLLPAQTLGAISFKDLQKAQARFQETGLWKILTDGNVQQALKKQLALVKGALAMGEQRMGIRPQELFSMVQGEFTIGFLGFLQERNEQGEPIPDLVLAFQPRQKEQAWMEYWNRMVDKINAQTENTMEIKQASIAGAEVITLGHQAVPVQISYTMCDGVFLATMGPGRIEQILAARQAALGSKSATAPAGESRTLESLPSFKRAIERAGADFDAMVFVNTEELGKHPEAKFYPKTDRETREWEVAGLKGLRAFSYSLGVKGKGLSERFFFDAPTTARTGLLSLLDGPPLNPEALALAPRNALAVLALQVEPAGLLDRMLSIASVENPQVKDLVNGVLENAGKILNLNFRKDLLGAFTGQAVFSITIPANHPKLALGIPRPILQFGIRDAAKVKLALDAVRRVAQDSFNLLDLPHGPYLITGARQKTAPADREPHQLCWCLMGDRLLVSLYPLALRDELDRLDALDAATRNAGATSSALQANADALPSDADFKFARGQVPGSPHLLLYLDHGALATAAYDSLVPIGQVNGKADKQFDIYSLPSSRTLAGYLSGALVGLSAEAEGVRLESYSSTGIWATVVPGLALLAEWRKNHGPVVQGADEPGLNPEIVEKKQFLRDIGRHVNAYARDHAGKFPASLQELFPKYLKEEARPQVEGIKFLGKQPAPSRVLAYASLAQETVPVLLQDGTVQVIHQGQLDGVLKDGFTGAKAKPWETGVAKPPLPPPDF